MADNEHALERMGQAWCDLGSHARNNIMDILAERKTVAHCHTRWQPRIEAFLKNLDEYAGGQERESVLEEIKNKATRIDAAHQSKYRK